LQDVVWDFGNAYYGGGAHFELGRNYLVMGRLGAGKRIEIVAYLTEPMPDEVLKDYLHPADGKIQADRLAETIEVDGGKLPRFVAEGYRASPKYRGKLSVGSWTAKKSGADAKKETPNPLPGTD
jgi:hypothetical protein